MKLTMRAMGWTGVTLVALVLPGWMCGQYIPRWYEPLWLTRAQIQEVRRHLEQTYDAVSHKMVAGRPFSIRLTERQVNEMLSAQESLWPAASRRLHSWLENPSVVLAPQFIRTAGRCRWGNIQTTLSVDVHPQVDNGDLTFEILAFRAGALPLPRRALIEYMSRRSARQDAGGLEWLEEVGFEKYSAILTNHFRWSNGNVHFRIQSISMNEGSITLDIEPLPRH